MYKIPADLNPNQLGDQLMVHAVIGDRPRRAHLQSHRTCLLTKFVAYRRHMKKRISFEMQGRVDDMVSKYIEFYSERSGQNK